MNLNPGVKVSENLQFLVLTIFSYLPRFHKKKGVEGRTSHRLKYAKVLFSLTPLQSSEEFEKIFAFMVSSYDTE